MKQYRAYCLDLDGTVYRGKEAVEGAVEFISLLKQKGYEPFYVTNNASKTQRQLAERLAGFGIQAEADRIMSSAIVAAKYIRRHFPGKRVYMIGGDGLNDALTQEGIEQTDQDADVVLMGMDPEVNFDKLAVACLEVRKGAVFISTNQDLAYPSEQGMLPGNGAFTTLVAASTGIKPLYIGKPESHMLNAIAEDWGFQKDEIVMIGDNYDTDILAGIQFGADTIHVNTGVTPTADALKKDRPPTYTIENLHSWEI